MISGGLVPYNKCSKLYLADEQKGVCVGGSNNQGERRSRQDQRLPQEEAVITTRSILKVVTEDDLRQIEALPYEERVPWQSIYDVFQATASLFGDRPALTVLGEDPLKDTPYCITHQQLLGGVTQAANMYAALGAKRQSVIALLSRSHNLIPALLWGAEVAAIASCVNYLLTPRVIASLLDAEQADFLVCPGPSLDPELWAKAKEVLQHTKRIKTVLILGGDAPSSLEGRDCFQVETLLAQQSDSVLSIETLPQQHDIAALFHTGGTTGTPKLVPQTHLNQIHAAWSLAQSFDLTEQDVSLNGFPLFHVGGTTTIGMSVLATGGHVVILSPSGLRNPLVVRDIWKLVERYQATFIGGVPTSIGSMSEVPVDGHQISSVRFAFTGGASLPSAVGQRFETRTNIPLLEQYGMTESVAAIAATPLHGKHKRGSVGLRSPFSSIEILDFDPDTGWQVCEQGQVGSVVIKGPQIVAGYLNPDHNKGTFMPDGGLITGDIGYLDEDGYLFLTGREKDLIIRSGHNIDPIAIEEVVNAHPNVAVSAAVGMPDEYAGEIPVVFIELIANTSVQNDALQAYIKQHIIEPPARPRHVFVIDTIPVTAVGKIFKPALRDLAVKHKLHMLVEELCASATVVDVSSLSEDQEVTLSLQAHQQAQHVEDEKLTLALSKLPIKVKLEWLSN